MRLSPWHIQPLEIKTPLSANKTVHTRNQSSFNGMSDNNDLQLIVRTFGDRDTSPNARRSLAAELSDGELQRIQRDTEYDHENYIGENERP